MSNINTNSIDPMFPVPGVNNSSQGFRDNFASIKNNLDTASSELTDLQNKVVLKSALSGTSIDNDMANTVISNAATRNFRSTLKDYGVFVNDPDSVIVDVSSADVHRGVITGTTNLIFAGWAPAGTKNGVDLHLIIQPGTDLANTTINFPVSTYNSTGVVAKGVNATVRDIQNYSANYASNSAPITINTVNSAALLNIFAPGGVGITHTNSIGISPGVTEMHLKVTSEDCGTTIDVVPVSRSFKTSQIVNRIPGAYGEPGDMKGAICVNGPVLYLCVRTYPNISPINIKSTVAWGNTPLAANIFGKDSTTGVIKLGTGTGWLATDPYKIWVKSDNIFTDI
jgi:hypothetical protein